MKITKYEHACLVLEQAGQRLVVDPGEFTRLLELDQVVAIVVTHDHFDHFKSALIDGLVTLNPAVRILTTQIVADQLPGRPVTVVADQTETIGPFVIRLWSGLHAPIHQSLAPEPTTNLSLLVNEHFYYAGDSFRVPEVPVAMLATPVSGPWLEMAEVIDFVDAIQPKALFPTHDALLKDEAAASVERWLKPVCDKHHIEFRQLAIGATVDM